MHYPRSGPSAKWTLTMCSFTTPSLRTSICLNLLASLIRNSQTMFVSFTRPSMVLNRH
ncbi:hypothetical protein JHK82_041968 [Glycine max]|nr:hypothetical protein JHK87_041925 [Glycine soja]KAG4948784.1 hypothetical protein JHK86_042023 [Glycine max]KAG4956259.1 hypothetical protein JHK85_042639 [Glycine max]KAG5104998.1 hypothetical protein JHK82_041968 [Glycine max]KAG5116122.1 hypothetical protein JHK84_042235 [Glycine max]